MERVGGKKGKGTNYVVIISKIKVTIKYSIHTKQIETRQISLFILRQQYDFQEGIYAPSIVVPVYSLTWTRSYLIHPFVWILKLV